MAGPATIAQLEDKFKLILNVIIQGAGIVAFIMLIMGGFQLLTSSGNPEKTKAAWGTITYSIIGLVLLIVIWFILLFIENFTGVTVTEFKIVQ